MLRAKAPLGTPVIVMRSRTAAQNVALRSSLPRLKPAHPAHSAAAPPLRLDVSVVAAYAVAAAPLTGRIPPEPKPADPARATWVARLSEGRD
jgi:hypothetical protein